MVRVTAWAIYDTKGVPDDEKIIGDFESIQVTHEIVRDDNDIVILRYFAEDEVWFDNTGNGWYDWTVEAL